MDAETIAKIAANAYASDTTSQPQMRRPANQGWRASPGRPTSDYDQHAINTPNRKRLSKMGNN